MLLCCLCPIHLSFHYVASHKDDLMQFEDLPLMVQLNVSSGDHGQTSSSHIWKPECCPNISSSSRQTVGPISVVNSHLVKPQLHILDQLSQLSAIPYWIQKGQLSFQLASIINWNLLGLALNSCSQPWMWLTKFASGHLAVRKMMATLWKCWESSECPMCHLSKETTLHVCQCPNVQRTSTWHHLTEDLPAWLRQLDMHPNIFYCISTMLHGRVLQNTPVS